MLPSTRADDDDDGTELGGVDAPDPSDIPIGDGIIPLLVAGLGYVIVLRMKKRKRLTQSN